MALFITARSNVARCVGRPACQRLARPFSTEAGYITRRTREIAEFGNASNGGNAGTSWSAYPSNVPMNTTVERFIASYADSLENGARMTEVQIQTSGRITSKREASKKLVFFDIYQNRKRVQVMAAKGSFEGDWGILQLLKRGDVVAIEGCPAKTKLGELTVRAHNITLLAPCLHDIPEKLSAPDLRFRQRYLDLIVNKENIKIFALRSRMLSALRKFLDEKGFLEVETPTLWPKQGGATATPFVTRSQAIGNETNMYLRIAPELFLKELVIGGMEKVYEIGKVFRNEGIDSTHNPEFTTCEFYEAYEDLDGLMNTTERLIRAILLETNGCLQLSLHEENKDDRVIDFEPSFEKLDVMDTLAERIGEPLPDPNGENASKEYMDLYARHNLPQPSAPLTPPRLIDKLIGHLIEPTLIQPTFLLHHPVCLSPLAKSSPTNPEITRRFELFVAQREICNAYEELNEPEEQRMRLLKQQNLKQDGDTEAHPIDEHFCTALEYALPPTVGWGMGLDRLMMLISKKHHIREVMLFPVTRPQNSTTHTSPPDQADSENA